MDFNTTRSGDGNLTTSTPGHSGSAGDDFSQIIGQILQRRQSQGQPQQSQFTQKAARAPQMEQQYQSPMYRPQMGTQQSAPAKEDFPSRMVKDPYWNPNDSVYWGAGRLFDSGIRPKMVKERFIGGQWEFDNVDPFRHGSGGAPRFEDNTARDAAYKDAASDARMEKMNEQVEANRRLGMPGIQPVLGLGGKK